MKYKIGDIIENRSDGSFIYMSHKGCLNLDDDIDLKEAIEEDNTFLSSLNRVRKHETKVTLRSRKKRLPQQKYQYLLDYLIEYYI